MNEAIAIVVVVVVVAFIVAIFVDDVSVVVVVVHLIVSFTRWSIRWHRCVPAQVFASQLNRDSVAVRSSEKSS